MIKEVFRKQYVYDHGREYKGELRILEVDETHDSVSFRKEDSYIDITLQPRIDHNSLLEQIVSTLLTEFYDPCFVYIIYSTFGTNVLVSDARYISIKAGDEELVFEDFQ